MAAVPARPQPHEQAAHYCVNKPPAGSLDDANKLCLHFLIQEIWIGQEVFLQRTKKIDSLLRELQ
jgi:hypothetical protein